MMLLAVFLLQPYIFATWPIEGSGCTKLKVLRLQLVQLFVKPRGKHIDVEKKKELY
jgi:hypothetical protein